MKKANALIESYIKDQPGMKFIDVFPRMLGSDGEPRPEIFVQDRLHMNPGGFTSSGRKSSAPYLPGARPLTGV